MRALAARLGVTPMSLYHHVTDRAGLLAALSDRVYGDVPDAACGQDSSLAQVEALLARYHEAVSRHPQLTLAIFAEPKAFAGVTRQLTGRLGTLLAALTSRHLVWRDILVDHAHGSALALSLAGGDPQRLHSMKEQYRQALDCLLKQLVQAEPA